MTKTFILLLLASVTTSVMAQPFKGHLPRFVDKSRSSQSENFEKEALFRPAKMTEHTFFADSEWMSVTKYEMQYNTKGEKVYQLGKDTEGTKLNETHYKYDQYGMNVDLEHYNYIGEEKLFAYANRQPRTYDSQGRLTSVESMTEYADTTMYNYKAVLRYTADSLIMSDYSFNATTGRYELDYMDVFTKAPGQTAYTDYTSYAYENGISTKEFVMTNMVFNDFNVEKEVFEIISADFEMISEAFAGRIRGEFTDTRNVQLIEQKIGILYQPLEKYTDLFDSHKNMIESMVEYDYNTVTGDFNGYYLSKNTYTYDVDNMMSDLSEYESTDGEPGKNYLREYSDYSDVASGIAEMSPVAASLYPNPVADVLNISVDATSFTYALKDASGREVLRSAVSESTAAIKVGALQSGVYFIEVIAPTGYASMKFVK